MISGKVIISVMEPISTTDSKEEDVEDLLKSTREVMQQEYTKLKNE